MYKHLTLIILGVLYLNACSFSQQQTMSQNPYFDPQRTEKIKLSNEEWRKTLDPKTFHIAREKGTEWAFTGEYWNHFEQGTYHCAACGQALFRSDGKFESSCGWPSFFEPIHDSCIQYTPDHSHGMSRVEVTCSTCDAHLGHIFDDGPPPTYKRYCINSVVLQFQK